jgi:hypothetical protein
MTDDALTAEDEKFLEASEQDLKLKKTKRLL